MMSAATSRRTFPDARFGIASRSTDGARTGTSATRPSAAERTFSDTRYQIERDRPRATDGVVYRMGVRPRSPSPSDDLGD
jgi:hypothetical protein